MMFSLPICAFANSSSPVGAPAVYYDGQVYPMWYVAGYYHGEYAAVGLAVSEDGIHWKCANNGQPVFDPGPPDAFDEACPEGPCVIHDNGTWKMWCSRLMKSSDGPLR